MWWSEVAPVRSVTRCGAEVLLPGSVLSSACPLLPAHCAGLLHPAHIMNWTRETLSKRNPFSSLSCSYWAFVHRKVTDTVFLQFRGVAQSFHGEGSNEIKISQRRYWKVFFFFWRCFCSCIQMRFTLYPSILEFAYLNDKPCHTVEEECPIFPAGKSSSLIITRYITPGVITCSKRT